MDITTFDKALERTLGIEGEISNHPLDPGGLTYKGISRVYWPEWKGWKYIDREEVPPIESVEKFYRKNFWNRIQGEALSKVNVEVAMEVFDTAVNISVYKGCKILQEALNLLNRNESLWDDLVCDGIVGSETISALTSCNYDLRILKLLKVLNHLQAEHYINLMRRHPEREEFVGWFDRT